VLPYEIMQKFFLWASVDINYKHVCKPESEFIKMANYIPCRFNTKYRQNRWCD